MISLTLAVAFPSLVMGSMLTSGSASRYNCVICNQSYENDLTNCPTVALTHGHGWTQAHTNNWRHVPQAAAQGGINQLDRSSLRPEKELDKYFLKRYNDNIPKAWGWNPLVIIGCGECGTATYGSEYDADVHPKVPGIVHTQCWVDHCVKLTKQRKPVTCPTPGCGRKRDSHGLYKGGFYCYWDVVQEHKKRVDWENRSVKITTASTSKKQRKRKSGTGKKKRKSPKLNSPKRKSPKLESPKPRREIPSRLPTRTRAEYLEALRKSKERRAKKPEPEPKGPEGPGWPRKQERFWWDYAHNAGKYKFNPRYNKK